MAPNQIREISSKEVLVIRHTILKFAESAAASILPGDDDASALYSKSKCRQILQPAWI